MLNRAAIESDFAAIAARFELELEAPVTWPQPHGIPATVASIDRLRERNPRFFERFDYDWASDPGCYANEVEARFQCEALIVLAEVEGHPALDRHRPTVVRVVSMPDFASTTVRGDLCDYIVIGEAYFMFTREFAVLLKKAYEAAAQIGVSDLDSREKEWVGRAVEALREHDAESVRELMRPLQRHAVCLAQRTSPPQPELLQDWLDEGVRQGSRIAIEVALTYAGMDRFVLYHELAHCLASHRHEDARDLGRELDADYGALSLTLARINSEVQRDPEMREWLATPEDLVFGAASYLALLRIVLLFTGVYQSTATFADRWMTPGEGSVIENARGSLAEIETRLARLWLVVLHFKLSEISANVLKRVLSLHALYNAAAEKLLADSEIDFEAGALGDFDMDGALRRLNDLTADIRARDG